MTADLVVRPIRFTDDVESMRVFLELVGLWPRIEAERGGWVDLAGGGGLVALHAAATSQIGAVPGETTLSFECGDADALVTRLRSAGFDDAHVVDESYGRVIAVTEPSGRAVWIDERSEDLYGYRRLHGDRADLAHGAPEVVAVRFTADAEGYHRFLGALGLTGTPSPGWAPYSTDGHGQVGVHAPGDETVPCASGHAAARLSFRTLEDVDALHDRLQAAGHPVTLREESFASILDVVDPDGQPLEIHALEVPAV